MRRRWVVALAALVPTVLVTAPSPSRAATLAVTTTADDVEGSLRDRIFDALAGDTINVPAGVYELGCDGADDSFNDSGDLDIERALTIVGPVNGVATIRPAPGCDERVIDVVADVDVRLVRLTITGGREGDGFGAGGGIRNRRGALTLDGVVVSDNVAGPDGDGGGVYSLGPLTVRDSRIVGNRSGDSVVVDRAGSGGGIYVDLQRDVLIERTVIDGNTLGAGTNGIAGWKAGGGGLAVRGFTEAPNRVTVVDSTLSNNRGGVAATGGGGGAWIEAETVRFTDVHVLDNATTAGGLLVSGDGGGVALTLTREARVVDVQIVGGTFRGNSVGTATGVAASFPDNGGHGGGLYVSPQFGGMIGTIRIDGTRFENNRAGDATIGSSGSGRGGDGGNVYVRLFDDEDTGGLTGPATVSITGAEVVGGRAGDAIRSEVRNAGGGRGGGVHIDMAVPSLDASVEVVDTTMTGNTAGTGASAGAGGGLYVLERSAGGDDLAITGSVFDGNVAGAGIGGARGGDGGEGGGAWLNVTSPKRVVVDATTFRRNRSGDAGDASESSGGRGGGGGGVSIRAATTVVTDSLIETNTSGSGGAGITGSGAGGDGGGIRVSGTVDDNDLTMTDTIVRDNRAGDNGEATAALGGRGTSAGTGGGLHAWMGGSGVITRSTFSGNRAGTGGDADGAGGGGGSGGGMFVFLFDDGGELTVEDSEIVENRAGDGGDSVTRRSGSGGSGGGMFVDVPFGAGSGSLRVVDTRVEGNVAGTAGTGLRRSSAGSGGGIQFTNNGTGSFALVGSSVADNRSGDGGAATGDGEAGAPGGRGGGVHATFGLNGPGTIEVRDTSVVANRSGAGGLAGPGGLDGEGGQGGGLWLRTSATAPSNIVIGNSTVHGNTSGPGANAMRPGDGGGIYLGAPTPLATITSSTITANETQNGDNLLTLAGSLIVSRTVIGEAEGPGNNPGENCNGGVIVDGGDNVEHDGQTCGFSRTSAVIGLGPLGDHGGLGLTRVPRVNPPNDVLFDRIVGCAAEADQRGVTRPFGAGCDIGAVEAQPSVVAVDDIIAVGGGATPLDFVANDTFDEAVPGDAVVTIVRQPDDGTLLRDADGWTFLASQESGASTDFDYRVCAGPTDAFCDTATVTLVPESASRFVALPPARLFDTRPSEPGPGPKGFVAAESQIEVQVAGVGALPSSGITAVAINITATGSAGPGFVTAFASGTDVPATSNLNLIRVGQTVPNLVVVPVGADGKIGLFAKNGTHLLGDVAGYYTAAPTGSRGGRLVPLTPQRLFDTRPAEAAPGPKGFVGAGQSIDVQVSGEVGVPAGAFAVVMNLTATNAAGPGFVTAFPSDVSNPGTSNVNLEAAGATSSNLTIVPLGNDGAITLFASTGADLLADVTGYLTGSDAPNDRAGLFVPITPARYVDTRPGEPPAGSKGVIAPAGTVDVQVTGAAGVPRQGASALFTNITAIEAGGPGFVTAWPKGPPRPTASSVNVNDIGEIRPNGAVLPLGDGGQLSMFSSSGGHLLADAFGWFLS